MKKTVAYLSFLFVSIGVVAWARMGSMPQEAMSLPYVKRQASTPGFEENGHIHVSGTIIGGQFVGGGAGLTGVNADLLDGIDAASFLTSVQAPLTLVATSSTYALRAEVAVGGSAYAGVVGIASAATGVTYGVHGTTASSAPDSAGVRGFASNSNGTTFGVVGESDGGSGVGVRGIGQNGVQGLAANGIGVFGIAQASPNTIGMKGVSMSETGYGVIGDTPHAGSGSSSGVVGLSSSTAGRGVYGDAIASSGSTYGVLGSVGSPTGWAVFANGTLGASGSKSFRIDHPSDPTGKYLLHYSTESPYPQNFYVGNVVTDERGYAWVDLPEYFAEINTNYKYQLTVVDGPNSGEDDFVMVKVRRKIVGNRFQIRTSAPNVEVSWRVDADRNDLYVRNRKPKDVVDKEGVERGTYQHPEFYGEGPERGMNYRPREDANRIPSSPRQGFERVASKPGK